MAPWGPQIAAGVRQETRQGMQRGEALGNSLRLQKSACPRVGALHAPRLHTCHEVCHASLLGLVGSQLASHPHGGALDQLQGGEVALQAAWMTLVGVLHRSAHRAVAVGQQGVQACALLAFMGDLTSSTASRRALEITSSTASRRALEITSSTASRRALEITERARVCALWLSCNGCLEGHVEASKARALTGLHVSEQGRLHTTLAGTAPSMTVPKPLYKPLMPSCARMLRAVSLTPCTHHRLLKLTCSGGVLS